MGEWILGRHSLNFGTNESGKPFIFFTAFCTQKSFFVQLASPVNLVGIDNRNRSIALKKTINTSGTPLYPAGIAWLGLGVLYLGLMSMGAMFHLIPPILPRVIVDLGLSHGQGGMLMALFALPGIFLSLGSGWLVDRYGARIVGALGILLMGSATVALSRGDGYSMILLARLITGVGAVVGVVAMQRMVTRLFQGRPLGLPTGISGSAVPLGIIVIYNASKQNQIVEIPFGKWTEVLNKNGFKKNGYRIFKHNRVTVPAVSAMVLAEIVAGQD